MGEKHTLMIATVVDPGIILLGKGIGTSLTARRGERSSRMEEGRTWSDTTYWIWHIFDIYFLDRPGRVLTVSENIWSHRISTLPYDP